MLGPKYHRATVLCSRIVRHWSYKTRYIPDYDVNSQWLPVEYERGGQLISTFAQEINNPKPEIAQSLPVPQLVDPRVVKVVLKVLPHNGNLLVWGLNMDCNFWH